MKYCFHLVFLILFVNSISRAESEYEVGGPKFGPEFTFTSFGGLSREQGYIEYMTRLAQRLIESQPQEAQFSYIFNSGDNPELFTNKNRFKSSQGWSFKVRMDPGVIEVTMPPMSVGSFQRYQDNIQDAIFQTAYDIDFFAALYAGGGHINIDGDYFFSNPLLLRNFIVDTFNHNELSMGIFSYDTNNALPLELMSDVTILKVKMAIQAFDRSDMGYEDVSRFIDSIHTAQTDSKDIFGYLWHGNSSSRRSKHSALNFSHFIDHHKRVHGRIELRSARAQMDIYTWLKQIRLLKKRIDYLETIEYPISYQPKFELSHLRRHDYRLISYKLKPPAQPQLALQAFFQYVIESGENIEDHLDYVWPQWITSGEVEQFKKGLCQRLLMEHQ